MDASSIIAQVSRDDELGAFNNEKGVYPTSLSLSISLYCSVRSTPSPPLLSATLPSLPPATFSARCCRDFVPLHLLRHSHPCASPLPALPNCTSRRSSLSLCEHLLARLLSSCHSAPPLPPPPFPYLYCHPVFQCFPSDVANALIMSPRAL